MDKQYNDTVCTFFNSSLSVQPDFYAYHLEEAERKIHIKANLQGAASQKGVKYA